MPVTQIASQDRIPIEQHYRISAGPGAGKTYWLVTHIRNVLQNSRRLGCCKKIACITYTNVAVDAIIKRLNFIADRVEVSTIHSFIYNNILKPYISFIATEYEFNVKKMDGHDDHFISRSKISDWIRTHPNSTNFSHPYSVNQLTRIDHNLEAIGKWLSSINYQIDAGEAKIIADNSKAYYMENDSRRNLGKAACLDKLCPGLIDYKKVFWRKGILHHEDVLFFGYLLLNKFPFITTVLQAKFPYFFIDEFQDTSPIQAEILKIIGQKETIVGIIGDKAQSIYSFQGACPIHFEQFSLSGIDDYQIADNRRSTNRILDVLNHVRKDIRQNPIRNIPGVPPIVLVGDINWALAEAISKVNGESLTTLSRDNITSNALKRQLNSSIPTQDLIIEFSIKDSNTDRRRIIISCINAVELGKQRRFKEAIKEMEKNFYAVQDKNERKKIAFGKLAFLLSKYDEYKSSKLIGFYTLIKTNLRADITKLVRGGILDFYDNYTYEQLAVSVKISEDNSPNRTIHKAKGDEFDNVLVILKDKSDLNFLLNPNLSSEEHRIFYVAVSRSKERLFISIPELDAATEIKLRSLFDFIKAPVVA
jgi:DNA helicase-2/ATP-dependent DNA helicase PcrA